jgi:hypothetical protein
VTPSAGPPAFLNQANYDRIQVGMTLSEVEAILGPPHATGNQDVKGPDGKVVGKEVQGASWFWARASSQPGREPATQTKRITIQLQDGKVTAKEQVGLE